VAASPPYTHTVQSYSPGCANVHPHSVHGSLDPPNSASKTASRSVQPFSHSYTAERPTRHIRQHFDYSWVHFTFSSCRVIQRCTNSGEIWHYSATVDSFAPNFTPHRVELRCDTPRTINFVKPGKTIAPQNVSTARFSCPLTQSPPLTSLLPFPLLSFPFPFPSLPFPSSRPYPYFRIWDLS